MLFKDLIKTANCKVIYTEEGWTDTKIENVVAGDLMSEVLVEDEDGILLITNLNTDQVLHTANIVDAVAVLFVNGKVPQESMITLAKDFHINLLSTDLSMFEACRVIK